MKYYDIEQLRLKPVVRDPVRSLQPDTEKAAFDFFDDWLRAQSAIASSTRKINWSKPILFEPKAIRKSLPPVPGVYKFLQYPAYQRYFGDTPVLEIGGSYLNVRKEVDNHFHRHTTANRLWRIRHQPSVIVAVIYAPLLIQEVDALESALLREFEDQHWDLPVLNSQRGYPRDGDKHYRLCPPISRCGPFSS